MMFWSLSEQKFWWKNIYDYSFLPRKKSGELADFFRNLSSSNSVFFIPVKFVVRLDVYGMRMQVENRR